MGFEERYFREELDYLRQLASCWQRKTPSGPLPGRKDADPDIERLLEGGFSYRQSPPER
ncbi:hypothetical protein OIU92_11250 [Escherichia coli]|nr:hypothetical protein [Escherichia coli]